jgi:hypothetical protein
MMIPHRPGDEAGMIHMGCEDPASRFFTGRAAGPGGRQFDEQIPEPIARQSQPPALFDEHFNVSHDLVFNEWRGGN